MDEASRIIDVESVPVHGSVLFTVRDGFDEREAILTRTAGDVTAWFNYCRHWTDVRLDKGDGAPFRGGEVVCEKHGATFDADSGQCTHGPCEGAVLEPIEITVEDGSVYLADDDYRFDELGASADVDLSSRRGIGF